MTCWRCSSDSSLPTCDDCKAHRAAAIVAARDAEAAEQARADQEWRAKQEDEGRHIHEQAQVRRELEWNRTARRGLATAAKGVVSLWLLTCALLATVAQDRDAAEELTEMAGRIR